MSHGTRLKQVRKALHLSQIEFGKKLEIAAMIVSRLEKGETQIKASLLTKLDSMDIDIAWLLTGKGHMFKNNSCVEQNKHYMVPIVDISASAGGGTINDQELIIGTQAIGLEFKSYWGENTIILKISGDSMAPTIEKDSWVLVHKILALKSEGIFVFLHDNELRCKRIQKKSSGEIIVKSDNPLYETEIYPKNSLQLGDLILLGEVVGIMNKI